MALGQNILKYSKLCNLFSLSRISEDGAIRNPFFVDSVRTKHYNPKYKWHRAKKFQPVNLPDEESKKKNKKNYFKFLQRYDLDPPRYWKERQPTITSLSEIIDPYVPPEGDGKASFLSKDGAKEVLSSLNKKRESIFAIRKIKQYDSNFDVKIFPQEAHDIYVKAHTTLAEKNELEALTEFATEKAAVEMLEGMKYRTIKWKFIESLEPPVVVHARAEKAVVKTNFFAQVTVRFHTKQCLAIYDRFGRLYYGSEILAKDVLEYVVFEKHIINEYGVWRLHGKIIPDWIPRGEPVAKTFVLDDTEDPDELDEMTLLNDEQGLYASEAEVVKPDPSAPVNSPKQLTQ